MSKSPFSLPKLTTALRPSKSSEALGNESGTPAPLTQKKRSATDGPQIKRPRLASSKSMPALRATLPTVAPALTQTSKRWSYSRDLAPSWPLSEQGVNVDAEGVHKLPFEPLPSPLPHRGSGRNSSELSTPELSPSTQSAPNSEPHTPVEQSPARQRLGRALMETKLFGQLVVRTVGSSFRSKKSEQPLHGTASEELLARPPLPPTAIEKAEPAEEGAVEAAPKPDKD